MKWVIVYTLILENKKYGGRGPVLKFLILPQNLSTGISYAFLIFPYFSTHFLVLSYQITYNQTRTKVNLCLVI